MNHVFDSVLKVKAEKIELLGSKQRGTAREISRLQK